MKRLTAGAATGALAALLSAAPARTADFDLVVARARVVDGTGAPWFRVDVGVRGDRIAAVGDLSRASALRRMDVRDRVIAPGFIDLLGQSEVSLLVDGRGESKVRQGITTEITGELYSGSSRRLVLDDGTMTSPRPGRALRRGR